MNRIKRLLEACVLTGSIFFFISQTSAQQIKNEDKDFNISDSTDVCSLSPVFDYIDKYSVRLDKSAPAVVTLNDDFS